MIDKNEPGLSDRSLAVALITVTRYLASKDPGLRNYLQTSLLHAQDSSLMDADLAFLRILINSIGGRAAE